MDIAVVLSGHRHGEGGSDLMLHPFADSSLLEIALEKLQSLDAPCAKYVACPDREVKSLVGQYRGLETIRASHLLNWPGTNSPSKAFAHLRSLSESWILVVNPAFPFVDGELWWQVIEDFLATQSQCIVSAEAIDGPFFSSEGTPLNDEERLFRQNEAFMLISQEQLCQPLGLRKVAFSPYILSGDITQRVCSPREIRILETAYTWKHLGTPV